MVLLQLFIHRQLTPDQGQMYLNEMFTVGKHNPQGGVAAVKIPMVTRHENPFPAWLQAAIRSWGKCAYDSVNMCYIFRYEYEDGAEIAREWIDTHFRPWTKAHYPAFDIDLLHVRVMGEHEDVQGSDSF